VEPESMTGATPLVREPTPATSWPTVSLTINGSVHEVSANPKSPLLYVLRNHLGLKAAKFGCGMGLCGACFVWLDGRATQSCDVPIEGLEDTDIRTLEGLDVGALQSLFIELQAGQCGYCIPGILVSAAALLETGEGLSKEEVTQGLDRNLCRCGAHGRIVEAVYRAQGE
jgi:nicotinate dehydrogenase subunit A